MCVQENGVVEPLMLDLAMTVVWAFVPLDISCLHVICMLEINIPCGLLCSLFGMNYGSM